MQSTWNLTGVIPIIGGLSVPRGIAVDNVNHATYWTASNLATGGLVQRKLFNGTPSTLIMLPANANPRGIAVDPVAGRIFWADFNLDAIYRANLDGTGVTSIVALTAGSRPYGVALDTGMQRLYWTEYGTGLLMRCDYNGGAANQILNGLANPTYIVVEPTAGFLFWTDGQVNSQRIRRCNLNGSGLINLPSSIAAYGGIAVGPGVATAVPEEAPITGYALNRPWPNPAAGAVHVAFALPAPSRVRLTVFDVQGREVAVLRDEELPAGRHEVRWDGRSGSAEVPAGVYFARLTAAGRSWTERLVLSR